MKKDKLCKKWADQLSKKTGRPAAEIINEGFLHTAFSPSERVEIEFEDGSHALFNYAFALYNPEKRKVAVFTEHCGHFEFLSLGIQVTQHKKKKKKVLVQM